ncbi:glycosyltransferase [Achromobacter ruhlandii]|uniref:Glycosyltransferase 2-like domain-containing protein n=1 Tax=Achromobacter ruhlandii TaxID=72557 RepID=A0ABM8M346_9BURK|nr:glycosyltransferase [Achromobacter ruhlandii]AKP90557.1 glycosyl transferase, family 2 [Achromobacter xylosoxidans]AOU93796.1 glycosyl transferase [Achromobacter ruhlandii]MCZ8432926.1 glycosyltransferase [Achromobacter ruhlandii]MDC6090756.1 glycosyltransferase [Achromobacter ruhlandii]MDC6152080.1 glycosyltransferase [Achromobacter ruhlandii]
MNRVPVPCVSVVVPTFKRPLLLARCLAALARQDIPRDRYEVLVCDDAASAATRRQVEALRREWQGLPSLRYLEVSGTRGPAGARNLGWRSAKAELIAFTDDDTIVHRDWLRRGLHALGTAGADTAAVSGATDMPLPDPPNDYERDAAGLTRSEFITANCFLRRSALVAVGGFDPRYTMAWREDSDLHFALLDQGLAVRRAEEARVTHPLRPVRFAAGLGMQKKVMFDMLLRRKYPLLYRSRIRPHAPRFYLAVSASLLAAAALAALGHWTGAAMAAALWLALSIVFFLRRLRGTRRTPRDVADLAVTSACIPVLSIAWRTVGLLRFARVRP